MASSSHKCPYGVAFSVTGECKMLYCGQWSCPRCSKLNARMWSWRVRLHIEASGEVWYFMTFTLRPTVPTVRKGYQLLKPLWDLLRKHMKRFAGRRKWEYIAFVEGQRHRGGMPHFHIISNLPAPIRIKDFAMKIGFGYQADQSVVNSDKAASYCAKYASKFDDQQPKNLRHVRVSQKWTKLPERDYPAYIVRARGETLDVYLFRVADISGKPIDGLGDAYLRAVRSLNPEIDNDVV